MKKSKLVCVVLVLFTLMVGCVFSIYAKSTAVDSADASAKITSVSVDSAKQSLILAVNYTSQDALFEIACDPIVSTDKGFSSALPQVQHLVEGSLHTYVFSLENQSFDDKIYIKPPVLYKAETVSDYVVSLNESSASSSLEMNSIAREPWLSVASVSTAQFNEELYAVEVLVTPHSDVLPRFPKLMIEDQAFGGISSLKFAKDGTFVSGKFVYYIPASSEIELASKLTGASLVVKDSLVKMDVDTTVNTSKTASLAVFVSD